MPTTSPPPDAASPDHPASEDGARHWRANLWICTAGGFTTIVAMTLLLPVLPLYIAHLGVTDPAAVLRWSGVIYAATFVSAGLTAPLWGRLGDRYGRKLMLIRASLGMAVAMSLMGFARDVWQLAALRLLVGLLGGYASGATLLVAAQTPKAHTGRALGTLSSGIMAGTLAGPLIGGFLPALIGIRGSFLLAGAVIFVTFLATAVLLREAPRPRRAGSRRASPWGQVASPGRVGLLLVMAGMFSLATVSIEPILASYVGRFVAAGQVSAGAGIVFAAAAIGGALSSPVLGQLADRIGAARVLGLALAAAAVLVVAQAVVVELWQLIALRFAMGVVLGGVMPAVTTLIRRAVPEEYSSSILSYSVSSQYLGQVVGPVGSGFIAATFGAPSVFVATGTLLAAMAILGWSCLRGRGAD